MDAEYESVTQERETSRAELLEEMREDTERLRQAGYAVSAEVHFGEAVAAYHRICEGQWRSILLP